MMPPFKCDVLAGELARLLRRPITLSPDILHYIEATFGKPPLEAIRAAQADSADGEMESLLELIVFPDEALQAEIEAMLETSAFEPRDEDAVLEQLLTAKPVVTIKWAPQNETIQVALRATGLKRFIARLLIAKQLNPRLIEAIERHISPARQTALKVKLRNLMIPLSNARIDFLVQFFRKMDDQAGGFADDLAFAFDILGEITGSGTLLDFFTRKKEALLHHYQKARKMDRLWQETNMETLLLSGERRPYIDGAKVRRQIESIDTICLALFGKRPICDSAVDVEPLTQAFSVNRI